MANVFTKIGTPEKGASASVQLNKLELAALVTAEGDSYYDKEVNWKTVKVKYKSATGNQRPEVIFTATDAGNLITADFSVSSTALDDFEVQNIIITDFDGGKFNLNRTILTPILTQFDVSIASISAPDTIVYNPSIVTGFGPFPVTSSLPTINLNGGDAVVWSLFQPAAGLTINSSDGTVDFDGSIEGTTFAEVRATNSYGTASYQLQFDIQPMP
jgi:hypothetical protein